MIIAQPNRGFYGPASSILGGSIMKKLILLVAGASVGQTSVAYAHPTDVPFATRGQCEVAYETSSKLDRERLVGLGIFDTYGAAQSTFRDLFQCEYNPDEDAWYIVFIGGTGTEPPPRGGQ
jgi:hypothetical protein